MEAGSYPVEDTRPVIYVAGGADAAEFINALVQIGQNSTGPDVVWWSPFSIPSGRDWQVEVEQVMKKSIAAFFVLSPLFLKSPSLQIETGFLIGQLGDKSNGIIPILYEECYWQRLDFLIRRQIFGLDRPFQKIPPEDWELELESLLLAFGFPTSRTTPSSSKAKKPPLYSFNLGARLILKKAERLAETRALGKITSSCLLFGVTESATSRRDTARFLRDLLDEQKLYLHEFEAFQRDGSDAGRSVKLDGVDAPLSPNGRQIIQEAREIAHETGRGTISTRHLAAALLLTRGQVAVRISAMGMNPARVRERFFGFVASVDPSHRSAWARILRVSPSAVIEPPSLEDASIDTSESAPSRDAVGTTAPAVSVPLPEEEVGVAVKEDTNAFRDGMTGYTSEFCGLGQIGVVSDYLDVHDYANRFASLIVSSETHMPLAIGLFGNWGSGKSHFMNLIDQQIRALALEEKQLRPNGELGSRCRNVVSIHFNAWHYSDTNLWASIISEIFEKLFSHFSSDEAEQLKLLKAKLENAGGVTTLAMEESLQAERAVVLAKEVLQSVVDKKETLQEVLRGFRKGLKDLVPELNTVENREKLFTALGIQNGEVTFEQLKTHNEEVRSIIGKGKELGRRIWAKNGRAVRFGWLLAWVAFFFTALFAASHLPLLNRVVAYISPTAKFIAVACPSVLAWLVPIIKKTRKSLDELEKWQSKAEKAQESLGESPELIQAEQQLKKLEDAARIAKDALVDARAKEAAVKTELQDTLPQRRLTKFIEARATSSEYRGQLGLVSLARKDLAELSRIFTDTSELGSSITDDPAIERSLFDSIDRVVLYIDDLDRCQAETVVDVLQAVHLLLAYPLFAVIVGVDQRCLKRSLQLKFRSLMIDDQAVEKGLVQQSVDREESPATPLDYLEKIFHIPFHLPPMERDAFGTLMEKLSAVPERITISEPDRTIAFEDKGQVIAVDAPPAPVFQIHDVDHPDGTPSLHIEVQQEVSSDSHQTLPSIVPLERWEVEALKQYHALIRTPRGATRLLNTYRLVKSAVRAEEWQSFRGQDGGGQQFRLAMLFLAAAAGTPAVAREWFQRVRVSMRTGQDLAKEDRALHGIEWERFRDMYTKLPDWMMTTPQAEDIERWLNRVERYTF